MGIVSIRGATTVNQNEKHAMLEATHELLKAIIKENQLEIGRIIQIQFTCTKDLDAVYPAVAARDMGICHAALLCMQEMYVHNSLSQCIRVALLVEEDHLTIETAQHQYLRGATVLRPDLAK